MVGRRGAASWVRGASVASAGLVAALMLLQQADGFQIAATGSSLLLGARAATPSCSGLGGAGRGSWGADGGGLGPARLRPRRAGCELPLAPCMVSGGRIAKLAVDAAARIGGRAAPRAWLIVLSTLPLKLWQWYAGVLRTHGLLTDSITTMFLYLLGQGTLGLITGKMQPRSVLARWAFFGILDGSCTHWWYHASEAIALSLLPVAAYPHMWRVSLQLLMTASFYTPMYCLLFIVVSGLWDRLDFKALVHKVKTEGKALAIGTVPTWTVINIFLFIYVSKTYRVLIAELFHYVYLIGLALWELSIVKKNKTVDSDSILEELEMGGKGAKSERAAQVLPTAEGGVVFTPPQASGRSPDGVVMASASEGLEPLA